MKCPICLKRDADVWDHDHGTDEVRGRICGFCTRGMGCFFDDLEAMQRAIDYLRNPPLRGRLFADVKREYMRAKMREWRAANPEKVLAANARAYARDPELKKRQSKAWHHAHPEYMRERDKRRRADPEEVLRIRERHNEWMRERMKDPEYRAAFNARQREYQRAAAQRKREGSQGNLL